MTETQHKLTIGWKEELPLYITKTLQKRYWILALKAEHSDKETICRCRRQGFNLWDRKIPWRRTWLPAPVFLPIKFHRQRRWQATVHVVTTDQTWLSTHMLTECMNLFLCIPHFFTFVWFVVCFCMNWHHSFQPKEASSQRQGRSPSTVLTVFFQPNDYKCNSASN